MTDNLIEFSPSAYRYPLLIKHLLHYPMVHAPDQEIVYRDLRRHSYRVFRERIGRLASGLSQLGVRLGRASVLGRSGLGCPRRTLRQRPACPPQL